MPKRSGRERVLPRSLPRLTGKAAKPLPLSDLPVSGFETCPCLTAKPAYV
ncbi:hypothetical protein [Treponema endosymbiont of Eucomonympha sp.]|nr:hypothetical protein [Treponema endosymbiont of Eucomonympha sp.]